MNIMLLGAAGFIGTNLVIDLAKNSQNTITVVDREKAYFSHIINLGFENVKMIQSSLTAESDFEALVSGQDIIYHLISTTVPTTSNRMISQELEANVILSSNLFEACVHQGIQKVVFISSGGTVYGKEE